MEGTTVIKRSLRFFGEKRKYFVTPREKNLL